MIWQDMTGKTALVTGASSGLGLHFARVLAGQNCHVILAARRFDTIAAIADEIVRDGGTASAVAMDVASSQSVEAALKGVSGPIDILVNNAGITATKSLLDMSEADFGQILDTNLKGVFNVAQAVARRMRAENRGGSIVNIASILGLRVASQVSAYAASKAAVIQLTKSMALEWARFGIRVNALCPGYIETPLNDDFFATDAGKALINRIPQRRLGRAGELDAPLLLLASPAGSYITGSVLVVDGGHLVSSL
jgi:NAD(P)-dependent dehydrogenase (short-subunit alcohol dehydrogenase family)